VKEPRSESRTKFATPSDLKAQEAEASPPQDATVIREPTLDDAIRLRESPAPAVRLFHDTIGWSVERLWIADDCVIRREILAQANIKSMALALLTDMLELVE
jgi:hypothetical protein